ncbi:MAG: hypothetical protein HY735_35190 [Verrucomicrobia bacterium]|nr:hypothetical protein [Verrucomicrobiota bacterium]
MRSLAPTAAIAIFVISAGRSWGADDLGRTVTAKIFKGVLIRPAQASQQQMKHFAADGYNAVVLYLDDDTPAGQSRVAARRIQRTGLQLHYWIEIARNPALADAHPEWMASLQTHSEWRRHFPKFPQLATNQVAKTYPWVPVLYAETFEVHRKRVAVLLKGMPEAEGIFLNDLQGAPSACGCGNHFCRWTTDYGPITTAHRLPNDAAANFILAVRKVAPGMQVIPVWTTECAEHDRPKGAACDGVACFTGRCWREYNAQLMPVAEVCERIGVLLPFRDFDVGLSRTGPDAEWQRYALNSFTEILPQREGRAIPQSRLIAVLQAWDVNLEQRRMQIRHAEAAGAAGYVMALTKIDQNWEPRLMEVPLADKRRPSAKAPHAHGSAVPH